MGREERVVRANRDTTRKGGGHFWPPKRDEVSCVHRVMLQFFSPPASGSSTFLDSICCLKSQAAVASRRARSGGRRARRGSQRVTGKLRCQKLSMFTSMSTQLSRDPLQRQHPSAAAPCVHLSLDGCSFRGKPLEIGAWTDAAMCTHAVVAPHIHTPGWTILQCQQLLHRLL